MASDGTLTEGGVEAGGAPPDCQAADDFYTPQAREAVGRFCERFLSDNALTPTELLHAPRHQQTLSNQAVFVGIMAEAERVQGRKVGALAPLVNEVARLTRERSKDWDIPVLKAQTYGAQIAEVLARGGDFTRGFVVDAALTLYLYAARSFGEKTRLLLDLAEPCEDAGALEPIDRLLAEIVRASGGLASITGDLAFAPLVEAIISLVTADKPLSEEAPEPLRRIETLMRRVAMPALKDALMVAFRTQLATPNCFTIASVGDLFGLEAVQREIMALSVIAGRLRAGKTYFGGERTEGALQRRMSLLLNEDTLPEMIKGRNFINKLRILFTLQRMPLAVNSARAVENYLKLFFEGREFAGRLLDCFKERNDKIKALAEVQKLVLDGDFPEQTREDLARMVDDVQNTFLRTQHALVPLTGRAEPQVDQVLEIVRLAGDGAYCVGKSRAAVAKALYRQVHRPRFIRAFLLSASGGKERATRVAWLRQALAAVGVPFIDMSALRVLVVDDEEGPRAFVASVLKDLGVGTIETAVDGRDALDRLTGHEESYDLVICDWMMPRVDGLQVLRQVRLMRPTMPFLMVTALATRTAVERALAHHVTAYIAKPFTPDQLEDKVLIVLTQKAGAGE